MRNHSNENEFDLHENEPVGGTHFHMNGFALRLVLKANRDLKQTMLATAKRKTKQKIYRHVGGPKIPKNP